MGLAGRASLAFNDMKDLGRDESVGRLLERALRRRVTANSLDDCPGADTLAAWSDGTLTAGERASVEAHAADCARCQAQLAAMARMMAAEPVVPQRSSFHVWPWLVPVTAAAAALVLWVWVQPPPPSGSAETRADVQTQAAPAAEPPAYLAEPGGRAATPPGGGATPRARAVTPPARPTTPPARAEAPPPAAVPSEEKRALDSTLAERQRDQEQRQPARAGRRAARGRSKQSRIHHGAGDRLTPGGACRARPLGRAADAGHRVSRPGHPMARQRIPVQRSTDAGATWQPQSPGVDAQFTAGASPQPSVCWLVGRGGIVLLSTDGQSWRRVPFPQAVDLVAVKASSASSASVTTTDGRVLATSDAGATWVQTP